MVSGLDGVRLLRQELASERCLSLPFAPREGTGPGLAWIFQPPNPFRTCLPLPCFHNPVYIGRCPS